MQKAQGLALHNKDRLESSRRQKDKDLQLQLKWTTGREIETADFPPVQHYYGMLPGEKKYTEEMGRGESDRVMLV